MGRLVAIDIESHKLAGDAALLFCQKRAPAVEVTLLEIDEPVQTELQRRPIAAEPYRAFGRNEIVVWHQEPGFNAHRIQRLGPDRADHPGPTGLHQSVPDELGLFRGHPDLIAQITGKAGPGGHDVDTLYFEAADFEWLQMLDPGKAELL